MDKVAFEEVQGFYQWWLWALFVGVILFLSYWLFQKRSNTKTVLIVSTPLLVIMAGIALLQLTTRIDNEGIHLTYKPFANKLIDWKAVETAEVIDYGFVGGWGYRVGTKYGTVYNVSGSKGLHLKLHSGRELVIGTQRPEEMKETIDTWRIE